MGTNDRRWVPDRKPISSLCCLKGLVSLHEYKRTHTVEEGLAVDYRGRAVRLK